MKTLFIDQLTPESGTLDEFFQVASVDRKTTSQGKPYLLMKLKDRTGEITGNCWDIPEDCPALTPGNVVKVRAEATTYRDALQLKVTKLRMATAEEVVRDDYMPASKHDRKDMFTGLCSNIGLIRNDALREMVYDVCRELQPQLMDAPAAKSNHQPYLGGLLEHILALCKLVGAVCSVYPELNRDVMMSAAILHDIGKCWELCFQTHIGYTRQGSTVGHIAMAAQLLDKHRAPLDPATYEHLLHLVLSHHGQREWGSPVVPVTREAQVFHLLDMIDSRYEMLTSKLAEGTGADGLTPFDYKLGCAVWNGK